MTVAEVTNKRIAGKYLNLFVHPSSLDQGTTEGMCGDFDGDEHNDVMGDDDAFSESTRFVNL